MHHGLQENLAATDLKAAPAEVLCPKCYVRNGAENQTCIHCGHALYVECVHCGRTNFRGLDSCRWCHKSLRHVRIVHLTAPGIFPQTIIKAPRLIKAYGVGFAVGCLIIFAILAGVNGVLDYYAHSQPPIEYTLGLPPYQDSAAPGQPHTRQNSFYILAAFAGVCGFSVLVILLGPKGRSLGVHRRS